MNWIPTFMGRKFSITDPSSKDVHIFDIVRSLSMQCRFNGHCDRFYSVAEHSVLLSQQVSPAAALCGLMHDATEADIGDIVRSVKNDENKAVEARIETVIEERFALTFSPAIRAEVKEADLRMLATEKEQLVRLAPAFACLAGVEPYSIKIEGWDYNKAALNFSNRFLKLRG